MMAEKQDDAIDRAFTEGTPIDHALEVAIQAALKQHKQAGNPIVVWRDGQLHWLQPEEIPVD